jgi:hypothetical protein
MIQLHFRDPKYREYFWFDIDRILNILFDRGYTTTRQDAQQAWEKYSNEYAAQWLSLPEDDDTVFNTIMGYLDVKI